MTIYTDKAAAWDNMKTINRCTVSAKYYKVVVDGPEAGTWAVMEIREAQAAGFYYSIAW